jgi:ribosome-associated toxin RatA of RatAB toxin-antitoxin module
VHRHNNGPRRTAAGERRSARQLFVTATLILSAGLTLPASVASGPHVIVGERGGVYTVEATFGVSQPASSARAVLTDYEDIPRFMPDVRRSTVLEQVGGRTVVEQEAVARVMMFSKRIHLVLEVHEESGTIRFRDRCGTSFAHYEGSWTLTERHGETSIAYQLTAQPSFDVPEFLVKRLLKRDATQMIASLQAEIAARSRRTGSQP